jgi:hypothetical protein
MKKFSESARILASLSERGESELIIRDDENCCGIPLYVAELCGIEVVRNSGAHHGDTKGIDDKYTCTDMSYKMGKMFLFVKVKYDDVNTLRDECRELVRTKNEIKNKYDKIIKNLNRKTDGILGQKLMSKINAIFFQELRECNI